MDERMGGEWVGRFGHKSMEDRRRSRRKRRSWMGGDEGLESSTRVCDGGQRTMKGAGLMIREGEGGRGRGRGRGRGHAGRVLATPLVAGLLFFLLCLSGVVDGVMDPEMLKEGQRGVRFFDLGQFGEALEVFQGMERVIPTDYEVLLNIALCLENLNDMANAVVYYKKAISSSPTSVSAWGALGALHTRKGEGAEAVQAFTEAIAISPRSEELYYNRGNAEQSRGFHLEAARDFRRATKVRPTYYEAWNNMGSAYMSINENKKAIDALRKTLVFIPTHPIPLTNLVVMENRGCDWSRRSKHLEALKQALRQEVQEGRPLITPFHTFEFQLTPEECQMNAAAWSARVEERVRYLAGFKPGGKSLQKGSTRLKIGYFSGSGFQNSTTTARSMRSQYASHNRMNVEVFCYAGQPDDGSEVRRTIVSGCDKFVELYGYNYEQIAEVIKRDKVNVLIDLTGYTMSMMTEVMAIGPSPIQVSFHGFPGTMGATWMQYLTADGLTTPPEHSSFYTEKLIIVPWTYLTNDHRQSRREVYDAPPSRSEFGFSDDDIIMCAFNQLYKIEPAVFDVWMRLLKAEPRAKLWLLRFTEDGAEKLQKYAEKHGVAKDRVVTHPFFPIEREFQIKGLGDLFLDTPLFNAHTTGGDVLWSGVPILTLPGDGFAQRVASGLIKSAGMGHMAARNLEEYHDMALALLKRPDVLKQMAQRLRAGREDLPLFDTRLLTADFEAGLRMSWEVYASHGPGALYHLIVSSDSTR